MSKSAITLKGEKSPQILIKDTQFVGVQFDAPATDAIQAVAEGLLETAKGLGILARVLNASDVKIETLLNISGDAPKARKSGQKGKRK